MTEAIAVSGVRKSYGRTVALDGLDLSVAEGEVHGFLGPNGSGKTTTIRILLGLLRAGGGTARLLGGDPWREATALHRRLAYVPGDVTLWPNFTGGEVIDLLGRLRGGVDAERRASLLERFDLDPTKKARAYSKGNPHKVALTSALAADLAGDPAGLEQLPGVQDLDVQDFSGPGAGRLGARVRCEVDTDKLDGLLQALAAAGVLSLISQPPTLEELFLRHYAGDAPGAAGGAPGGAGPAAGAEQREVPA